MTVNIRTALLAWKGDGNNGYGVREITHPQGQRWLLHFQESSPAASAHVWIWTAAYRTPGSAPSAVTESSRRSKIRIVKNSRKLGLIWKSPDTHLYIVLLHVDARVGVHCGVEGSHERVGRQWFWLMCVIGTVVMW